MKTNKNTVINTAAKIIIPGKEGIDTATQGSKEQILNNLKSITDEQIDGVGSDIKCKKLISDLENGRRSYLKEEDADLLLEYKLLSTISKHIKKFDNPVRKSIILKIIDMCTKEGIHYNWDYLDYFSGCLDSDVALAMIKGGFIETFSDYYNYFDSINKDVAIAYYEKSKRVIDLSYFNRDERQDIVLYYLSKGKERIDLSEVRCDIEFANKIIGLKKENGFHVLCKDIDKFYSGDHKEIALNLIKNGGAEILIEWIGGFEGMDKEVALALSENNTYISNLKLFETEDRQEIALNFIERGLKPSLEGVTKLNADFANKLIEKQEYDYLRNNIQYFYERDHKTIALAILEAGHFLTQEDLRKIKNKDKEFAMTLIQYVQEHDSDKHETTVNIIEYIVNHPEEFTDIDDDVASILIDMGYGSNVKKHKKAYKNLSTYTKMRLIMK